MSIDYIYESYFAVLGLTGAGKSSFLNAISDTDSCIIGKLGRACTQNIQLVSFVYDNHRFNALDTPGLDDTDNNEEKIKILKNILQKHPKIKKIIIIKKFSDLRLPLSMQNAFITFMEAFPLQKFWDHVIVVNTWANPHDETYMDYKEEEHETFLEKILQCKNLLNVMHQKNINVPSKIEEYFVCSRKIKKYPEISKEFDLIKKDIRSSQLMFKDVKISPILENTRKSQKNEGFYIIKKYRTITCVDFDDSETTIEEFIEENEVAPKDCQIISTEEIAEFLEYDEVKWYDILSLGIARAIRNTKKYVIYKVHTYQVGDKQIKGDKIRERVELR